MDCFRNKNTSWKFLPVPIQSSVEILIEEMRFWSHRSDVWMDLQELQERPCSALFHAYDDRLWEPSRQAAVAAANVIAADAAAVVFSIKTADETTMLRQILIFIIRV